MSDSSEEENVEMLLEATDHSFFRNTELSNSSKKNTHIDSQYITKPSLRLCEDEAGQHNPLRVTPEFQRFVGKQLMRIIESQLKEVPPSCKTSKSTGSTVDSGIRLFNTSSVYLSGDAATAVETKRPRPPAKSSSKTKRAKNDCSSSGDTESDQDARFAEAAVDADWILSKKAILGWEKSSKGEVIVVKTCEHAKSKRTGHIGDKCNTESDLTPKKSQSKTKKHKLNSTTEECDTAEENKMLFSNDNKVSAQSEEEIKKAKKKEKRRRQRQKLKLMKTGLNGNGIALSNCDTDLSQLQEPTMKEKKKKK